MPQQLTVSVENNFTKGLITESTGLNFPENAATDTDNCEYTLVGDVARRLGINTELNGANTTFDRTNKAMSTYVWNNPGGSSTARLFVKQIGGTLLFYDIAAATTASPLSAHLLLTTIDFSTYTSGVFDSTTECTYADGNGYLFVYHPTCNPFYITYSGGTLTSAIISVRIRDFIGADEGLTAVNSRPPSLSNVHTYNLTNQGWTSGSPWVMQSTGSAPAVAVGSLSFTVPSGVTGVTNGQFVQISNVNSLTPGGVLVPSGTSLMSGTVTSYSGSTLTVNVTGILNSPGTVPGSQMGPYSITPSNNGYINTWFSAEGNYPSNADVWWYFKDSTGNFNPSTTANQVTLNTGYAPRGHFILDAFNQTRGLASGVPGITDVSTNARPSNGCWFQGRVWYTGVSANQPASGTTTFYSWSENVYFSQVVQTTRDFGSCFQTNDPTSEQLNDILPTDGGVITISGSGKIYKLFPIANGLIIFAANGVWFITGSQGIGFAANDYTITKLSSVKSISSTSYVDVMGLPYFWNEEGIYQVQAQQNGGSLAVEPITVGTILSFFNDIPFASKVYVRGDYHPIDYIIQWSYRSTNESSVTDRYQYDRILNYNVYNKAFFPYTISTSSNNNYIHGVNYITYPTTTANTPDPGFKYHCSQFAGSYVHSFAEEYDDSYLDWGQSDYTSYFITGYKLRGQAIKKFQPQYVQMWYRTNDGPTAYKIQGIWDYAADPNSGRWTKPQIVNTGLSRYGTLYKRHKIRGRGYALQIKVESLTGEPFDIQGWAIVDTVNQST